MFLSHVIQVVCIFSLWSADAAFGQRYGSVRLAPTGLLSQLPTCPTHLPATYLTLRFVDVEELTGRCKHYLPFLFCLPHSTATGGAAPSATADTTRGNLPHARAYACCTCHYPHYFALRFCRAGRGRIPTTTGVTLPSLLPDDTPPAAYRATAQHPTPPDTGCDARHLLQEQVAADVPTLPTTLPPAATLYAPPTQTTGFGSAPLCYAGVLFSCEYTVGGRRPMYCE